MQLQGYSEIDRWMTFYSCGTMPNSCLTVKIFINQIQCGMITIHLFYTFHVYDDL